MSFDPREHSHRRFNPLSGEWVLVSPHRAKRPWQGEVEKGEKGVRPAFDPDCYLCPGNERAGGEKNPDYDSVFVFDNDFSALMKTETAQPERIECGGLVRAKAERGVCRVICFSRRHDLTLAEMGTEEIGRVIEEWCRQYHDLGRLDFIRAVTIFENKGAIMGCSNPHPHGQIWATESIPTYLEKEIRTQREYSGKKGSSLLGDYLEWEIEHHDRIVVEGTHFVALVPYWAVWPFETLVLPRRPVQRVIDLTEEEKRSWAEVMGELLIRYDNLFQTSFPYSMGIHQAPSDGPGETGFHLHQHFFPPLLRSATIKKFQVGYEMSGEPQRDITAEQACERLRQLPPVHYKRRKGTNPDGSTG